MSVGTDDGGSADGMGGVHTLHALGVYGKAPISRCAADHGETQSEFLRRRLAHKCRAVAMWIRSKGMYEGVPAPLMERKLHPQATPRTPTLTCESWCAGGPSVLLAWELAFALDRSFPSGAFRRGRGALEDSQASRCDITAQ